MRTLLSCGLALALSIGAAQAQERSKAPEDAAVYIVWPGDGQVIKGGKFWLRMGLRNFGIAPAGIE